MRDTLNARPLHVLLVAAPASFGGLESVVLALASGLRARGHRTTVSAACGERDTHPFVAALKERSLEFLLPPPGYVAEVRALYDVAVREQVDIIHSHGYRSDVLTFFSGAWAGKPRATTVHGFTGGNRKNRLYERIQLATVRRFEAIVAVSRPLESRLAAAGIPADRLHTLPNAYSPSLPLKSRAKARLQLGLSPEGTVIGWVGRLSGEKGPEVALHALASLRGIEWTAVFLGDGPERSSLQGLAGQLGIGDRVRWFGAVSEAGSCFTAFDAFLLSSHTEGTPIVLLEAMAAGVPVVATAVGGVPDVLGQGTAGWLVPAGDVPALGAALAASLTDGAAVMAKTQAARARLEAEYEPAGWIRRHEELYYQLLQRFPNPAARR